MIVNRECKLTVALVIAIAIAIYCATLVTISNFEHGGVITIDTFIGAGVGLIGICATVMVGLQIWNHIEFRDARDKINNIDKIEANLNDKIKTFEERYNLHLDYLSDAYLEVARYTFNPEGRIIHIFNSLKLYNWNAIDSAQADNLSKHSDSILCKIESLRDLLSTYEGVVNILGERELDYLSDCVISKKLKDHLKIDQYRIEAYLKLKELIETTEQQNNGQTKDAQPE